MSQVHSVQLSAEAMPFGQGYTNLAKKNQVGVPTTLTEALTVADLQGVLLQVQKLSQAIEDVSISLNSEINYICQEIDKIQFRIKNAEEELPFTREALFRSPFSNLRKTPFVVMKNVQTVNDYFSRDSRLPEVQRLYEKAHNKIDFTELDKIVKESLNDETAIPYDDYCGATRLVDRWVGLAKLKMSKIKGIAKPVVEASPQSLEAKKNSSNSENVDNFTTSLSNSITNYELVVPPLTDNSTEKLATNLTKKMPTTDSSKKQATDSTKKPATDSNEKPATDLTKKPTFDLTKLYEKEGIFGRVRGIVEEARYTLKNSDKYDSDGEAFLEH